MEKRGRKIFALTTLFASEYHHHAHFAQEGDATLLQSRSPHFKFSFLHCALQFESDMPPYSRAVQRYTSTLLQYKVVQGGQREDGRLRNLVNRCHETPSDLSIETQYARLLFLFHELHISGRPSSGGSRVRKEGERRNEYAMCSLAR